MKNIIFLLSIVLSLSCFARGGGPDTEADYIVPTPPEYMPYSRFKVDIVDRFEGAHTQKISYIFPEFLVGEANRVVEFSRIPGTDNSWSSPEMEAHCFVFGDEFSCNIIVKKTASHHANFSTANLESRPQSQLLSRQAAIQNLPKLNLDPEKLKGLTGVIDSFYSHEPAGFLTYDID